ncbi:MAG: cobalt-precorrin-6A synthase, partial [Clostridia bacterium]|nr:cobalt-precorrin-6A synthase [Clostridia bacterium]
DAFSLSYELGFNGALLVGHIGKLIKLAGGMFNTHSRYGDCRAEIFASHAAMCGASPETVKRVMESAMTDDMLSILDKEGLRENVMKSVMARIEYQLSNRQTGNMKTAVITFSKVCGILGTTTRASEILEDIRKEY